MILKYQIVLGCDKTSKVGTKSSALKSATNKNIPTLVSFNQASFDEDLKAMAEKFIVACVSKDENIDDFDNLLNKTYYKKSTEINIEKLPPTSSSIALHIKRAYLQTYIWLNAPFMNNLEIDPLQYGYEIDEDDDDEIIPTLSITFYQKTFLCPVDVVNVQGKISVHVESKN